MTPLRCGEGVVALLKAPGGSGSENCLVVKKGARNCQAPVWLKEELEIIRKAWSVDEAVILHDLGMTPETPYRSFDAIKKCWQREHPKIGRTDLRMKSELDKLEATV